METFAQVMPIILYILGAVLLVVLIVLFINAIGTVTRLNRLLDDLIDKASSLDSLFHIVDTVSSTLSGFADNVAGSVSKVVSRFFRKRILKDEEEEDYYE